MSNIPINIRIPQTLHAKIHDAAEKMDLPLADVIRQCLALGIQDLAIVGFDVDAVIHAAVLKARELVQRTSEMQPEDKDAVGQQEG